MIVFHRSQYHTVPGGKFVRCSWWQFGSKIFRYREF
jgi:hypothetical protein